MSGTHLDEAIANEVQNNEDTQDGDASSLEILARVKEENKMLRNALQTTFRRLGDEVIADSDSSLDDDDDEVQDSQVNTCHFEIDSLFAPKYYFITNEVSIG